MAVRKYYFRCKSNPSAPLLVLETKWEMQEMLEHPDYEQIDESGEVIVDEPDAVVPAAAPAAVAALGAGATTT